jgi:hypothetical protein
MATLQGLRERARKARAAREAREEQESIRHERNELEHQIFQEKHHKIIRVAKKANRALTATGNFLKRTAVEVKKIDINNL